MCVYYKITEWSKINTYSQLHGTKGWRESVNSIPNKIRNPIKLASVCNRKFGSKSALLQIEYWHGIDANKNLTNKGISLNILEQSRSDHSNVEHSWRWMDLARYVFQTINFTTEIIKFPRVRRSVISTRWMDERMYS